MISIYKFALFFLLICSSLVYTGTQYRSVIYFHSDAQKRLAEKYKQKLNDGHAFPNPVVTEITAAPEFYVAENQHQNYFNLHGHEPYCQFVAKSKADKSKALFGEKLKATATV